MGQITKASFKRQIKYTEFPKLASKKESAGLCFAKERSCSDILRDYIPDLGNRIRPGIIINNRGEQIGHHQGYAYR